ncbi:Gfo/Idh/MocA family protein [Priestia aryabhattai]
MVRFGVLGTSLITETFLNTAKHVKDFKLEAVYSRTLERAEEFGKKYGVDTFFTDLEEMACSPEIDAVYIATPNAYHAEQAILFLRNKKHVLCEKPMAANAIEVKKMINCAKENEVLLMEAMIPTLLPNFKAIKDNLHKVGRIQHLFINYCKYSSRYDDYKAGIVHNAFNPLYANGALMDIGVYCLYPLIALFGTPTKIAATSKILDSGVDGRGNVLLSYPNKNAIVTYSKLSTSHLPSEIQGEDGSLIIDKIATITKVKFYHKDGVVEDLSLKQDYPFMYYELKEFIDLIVMGRKESKVNSYKNSYNTMLVMDEIRRQIGVNFPNDIYK